MITSIDINRVGYFKMSLAHTHASGRKCMNTRRPTYTHALTQKQSRQKLSTDYNPQKIQNCIRSFVFQRAHNMALVNITHIHIKPSTSFKVLLECTTFFF